VAEEDLQRAAAAWNQPDESLSSAVRRIPDRVPEDRSTDELCYVLYATGFARVDVCDREPISAFVGAK
jgi:hypothetical protein